MLKFKNKLIMTLILLSFLTNNYKLAAIGGDQKNAPQVIKKDNISIATALTTGFVGLHGLNYLRKTAFKELGTCTGAGLIVAGIILALWNSSSDNEYMKFLMKPIPDRLIAESSKNFLVRNFANCALMATGAALSAACVLR